MSGPRSSRSVFVGNIPYDATEEQLTEVFSEIGRVISFRLVFDRDTGKPKGYGFCEYADAQTALSAMRNLNGHDMGGRSLRVDFAESEKGTDGSQVPGSSQWSGSNIPSAPGGNMPHGSGSVSQQNINIKSDIAKVLEGMSTSQLYEIMVQMKGLMTKNPEQAKQLLLSNPPFSYALLQASVLLGLITSQTAQQMQILQQPPLHKNPMVASGLGTIPMGMGGAVPGAFFTGQPTLNPFQAAVNPAFAAMGLGIPQQPTMSTDQLEDVLPDDQKELLAQVMQLTPEQIEKLPPHEQAQILQLRQTMMTLNYSRR